MIKPIGSMLLVTKVVEGDRTTATGLVISAGFDDYGPKTGKVVAMGDGEPNYRGEIIPIHGIDIGDTVMYPQGSGTEVEDGTDKYLLINSKHIMAIKEEA